VIAKSVRLFSYVTTPAKDAAAAVARLSVAITDINDWMKASRQRLNPSKTQVMWLGTKQQLDKIIIKNIPLLSTVVTVASSDSTMHGISASILTVNCRWTCTLLLSATAATISYDNSVP